MCSAAFAGLYQNKSEWQTYYDNIGKDSESSLDIPDKTPKKQTFYGSDGSTWT